MRLLTLTVFILLTACGNQMSKESTQNYDLKDEVRAILKYIVGDDTSQLSNIHFMVDERFNDSTFLAQVWINGYEPKEKYNIDSLDYLDTKVYIYNENNREETDTGAFYVPDSGGWTLLIFRRKSGTKILTVTPFEKYDDTISNDDLVDQF